MFGRNQTLNIAAGQCGAVNAASKWIAGVQVFMRKEGRKQLSLALFFFGYLAQKVY
jgi:hypothetical protein